MAETYYSILTSIGKAQIANSLGLGTKVDFVKMKVGDGNGSYYNPTESQTDLVHTVWEGAIGHVAIDEDNSNWINIEVLIPPDVGGFMIREYGVFDGNNNLLAIAKCAETYKPLPSDGSTKEINVKMVLAVSNTSSITLKIDPTILFAKKKEVDEVNSRVDGLAAQMSDMKNKTNIYQANTSGSYLYTISIPGISSYADILGIPIVIKATVANSGGASLNINSYGAKSMVRGASTALVTGDIPANKLVQVIWDGTYFQVQSQGGDVVQLSATQVLTNKTLTSPALITPRLGSSGYIADMNGNEILKTVGTLASAVNEITVGNAATNNAPSLSATGGDTNINLNLISKGTGRVQENGVNIVNANELKYQTAIGTATAITLTITGTLVTGYPVTFIASANNNGAATTINSKPLYKPNTTTAPNLIAGKAYTVWYNQTGDCFFIKASAEGNVLASQVLLGKSFSNDDDTGLIGSATIESLGGKKIATGTATSVASGTNITVKDMYGVTVNMSYITVTGFDFLPSNIVIVDKSRSRIAGAFSNGRCHTIYTAGTVGGTNYVADNREFILSDNSNIYVTNGSIQLPCHHWNTDYTYYIYE